ncbi:MAG: citrate synthase [Lachnospiraceae bacterium]|nr:citrate synthase [Lachnospiraceae bacterium]
MDLNLSEMEYLHDKVELIRKNDAISPNLFSELGVKRGLRDEKGRGVLTGLTSVSRVDAFKIEDSRRVPIDGQLYYRGYNVQDLIAKYTEKGFGYERAAYLLLFGELPDENESKQFFDALARSRQLPKGFTRDIIMKTATKDIMNSMTRSILAIGSYEQDYDPTDLQLCIRQSLQLIAAFPLLAIYAYHAYNYYQNEDSMYIHRPLTTASTAENILRMLRPDMSYSDIEIQVLDACLMLHMEHGGGNNSTFTTRVVTSSGSDTYSAIAAAMSSLKGPKHGGANIKVAQMFDDIKAHVKHPTNEGEVRDYLHKIVDKQAFDGSGLIYGMGHAIYSLSDPRERLLKSFVDKLAAEKGREEELALYESVEKLAPYVIAEKKHVFKEVSPNIDFYSGFVYDMLGIPRELFTPLFAIARISGWCAHRLEELVSGGKIIRPAYMSIINVNNTNDPNMTKAIDE